MTCAPSHFIPERNKVGRPRTVCPSEEELVQLGIEMIEWFKVHPDALHVSDWYSGEKFIVDNVWDVMIQKPEFLAYYEFAMKLVGKKYLDKTSNVREGASQRWQRVYFKDLRKQEDRDAEFAARLKIEESKFVDAAFSDKFDLFNKAIEKGIEKVQSSKALKSSDISSNADAKS